MQDNVSGKELSELIRIRSAELGFELTGIAEPRELADNAIYLNDWVSRGMNDRMNYLARDIGKRADPRILFPEVKSIVVTGLNYYSEQPQTDPGLPVISRYAYGKDYHDVIKGKLDILLQFIRSHVPGAGGRIFVDSAPIMEKPWAVEAGLGWQGKHSVVINPGKGSFFFIGILALDIVLDYDKPFGRNLCGTCNICVESCPTSAINGDGTIDARRCISNLTIENRGTIPEDLIPLIGNRVYGCDICQEVCPWNRHAAATSTPEFRMSEEMAGMTREDWRSLTREKFEILFSGSPVMRVGYEQFRANLDALMNF